ncbi:MAG: hypothetical protein MZV65_28570 [Chromatiales bacterium]|nr:hypothetical protein [Chromatiales bacterium]
MIRIQNRGQAIAATDYWSSAHAANGLVFLSWNAGCARLLIPDAAKSILRELKGAREVIISRGPWVDHDNRDALELLWEDGSDAPFALHIVAEQCDRLIPDAEQGGGFQRRRLDPRRDERALAGALSRGPGAALSRAVV